MATQENPGGLALHEPRYQWAEWINERQYWRDHTFIAMQEEFKNFVEGILNIFAHVASERPNFNPHKVTFQRPRWMKEGKIVFDITYDGQPMLPHDQRWS